MNLLGAYQALKKLEPSFLTREAAAVLEASENYTAVILKRLAQQNTIVRVARGRWAYSASIDPLLLPSILVYPMRAYISLYSALYYHGMIDQIPSTVFAISLGKTKVFHTPLAKVSLHNIQSYLFVGYESYGQHSLLMASPEKALFDTLYLMPAKSHLFSRLTEVELPEQFKAQQFEVWLKLVQHPGRRRLVEDALGKLLKNG